tara:strand:- start:430 stop:561 length:132 start_codon:yes stop_codon:yes gene_type:complete
MDILLTDVARYMAVHMQKKSAEATSDTFVDLLELNNLSLIDIK